MQNEERYKLFTPLLKPTGGCDHIGPSPAYTPTTGELVGYRVSLYRGRLLGDLYRAEDEAEIFPIELWEQKRDAALAHLQE